MLTNRELKRIEIGLIENGLSENQLRDIRKSKICIIDNEIEDLKSLHDSLKLEGFSNLKKFKKSPPINELLTAHYDIILLDLNDVANEITELDGLGILQMLKDRSPSLPILVITGQNTPPEMRDIINKADLVRKKPILASDLANDVDSILRYYHNKFWASVLLLKELNKIDIQLKNGLSFFDKVKLAFLRKGLEKKLTQKEDNVIQKLEKILKFLKYARSGSSVITKLCTNFITNA